MGRLSRALVLAAVVLALLAPSASAAGFTFLAGKHLEATPGQTGIATYEMPLRIEETGSLYAKLLATDGNAVHDGRRANGSVADATGWRLELALRDAGGTVRELGTYVDGTPTALVPVTAGDEMALLLTLHVPEDARRFGERQVAYVALAFRLDSGTDTGTSSGASMDQARAITLIVHLPGAAAPAPGGETPAEDPGTTPVVDPGEESPSGESPGGEGPAPGTDPGPVGPVPSSGSVRVVVEQAPLPAWFLGGALALGAALLVVLVVLVLLVARVMRTLPFVDRVGSRSVPVEADERVDDVARPTPRGER